MDLRSILIFPAAAPIFCLIGFSWWNIRLVDQLLKQLYESHRDIWQQLGEPSGSQWTPPGRFNLQCSPFHFDPDWYENDPVWLQQAPELRELFYKMRSTRRLWHFRVAPIAVIWAILFWSILIILGWQTN